MGIKAMILLGAPGAGKGTMAEVIKDALPITHIATGDMLREEISRGSALGRQAETFMQKGLLVPDDLIVQMVMDKLAAGSADARCMFDGFPRTLAQAVLLDQNFNKQAAELSFVILLDTPPEVSLERLTGRRVCKACGANYHVRNIPPRVEGVCDHCKGELYQRTDDNPATIKQRLEVFRKQNAELTDYYESQAKLVRVKSSGVREKTSVEVLKVLKERGFLE